MKLKAFALLFLGPFAALASPKGSFEKSMPNRGLSKGDDPRPDRAEVTGDPRPRTSAA